MLYNTFEADREYLLAKFRNPVFEPDSGRDNESMKAELPAFAAKLKNLPRPVVKARTFEWICRNIEIGTSPHDWFPAFGCWNRNSRIVGPLLGQWNSEVNETYLKDVTTRINQGREAGLYETWKDFDHSVPDWEAIFLLGFSGLRGRARQFRSEREAAGKMTDDAAAYFDSIEIEYCAILEMLGRFRTCALKHSVGNDRLRALADALGQLTNGTPRNTYEALLLIYLYFMFGEHIDHMQVRSLGNLDRILYSYYRNDLDEGRYTEENIREFFAYFLMQYASINNYWGHPFYLSGTKADGTTEINELSYLILDVFDSLSIPSPKIQLKIADNTPGKFIDKALDMIRRGNNSLVFLSENGIRRAMMSVGYSAEQARLCHISGCYEIAPRDTNVTAGAYLNLLKPVELIFNDGIDPRTGIDCGFPAKPFRLIGDFDSFYKRYIQILDALIERTILETDANEEYLHLVNPGPVFSATIENSLKTAKDAFSSGSVYNNTIILFSGFASAIDALTAVRVFVFEKKELELEQLAEILRNDWKDAEVLRLRIRRSPKWYGNGDPETDFYTEMLANFISSRVNNRPNGRGGFYWASLHAARTFLTLGQRTGATPDGRKAGEEMSKNASPVMGADINGVTALVNSVTKMDSSRFPGGFPLDILLHPATVQGAEGLSAMRTVLKSYMARHGLAIQFNIFDAETLLDAQAHPEKYESLQVRVCGWNVRFNDLCKKEQDAYIERARNVAG